MFEYVVVEGSAIGGMLLSSRNFGEIFVGHQFFQDYARKQHCD